MKLQEIVKQTKDLQLGKIINYLLEESKNDKYLSNAIDKVQDKDLVPCWNYITEQVAERTKAQIEEMRKAGGNMACICFDDTQVYDIAKEYFLDYEAIQQAKAEKKTKEEKEKAEREAKAKEQAEKNKAKSTKATPKKSVKVEETEEDNEEDTEEEIKDNTSKKKDPIVKATKTKAVDPMEEIRRKAQERAKQLSLFDFE